MQNNIIEYKQQDLIEFVNEALGGVVLEERGRVPFIEQILNELETKVCSQIDSSTNKGYWLDKYTFCPSFKTFFKKLTFFRKSQIIINNELSEPYTYGYLSPSDMVYANDGSVEILPIFVNIRTSSEDFSFAFRSVIAHELMHAYDLFSRGKRLTKFPLDRKYRDRIAAAMANNDAIWHSIGYLFYFSLPHEKKAFSQQIQTCYKDNREIFGKGYETYPFEQIISNLPFFRQLADLFDDIEHLWNTNSNVCIQCIDYILGPQLRKRVHSKASYKKIIDNICFDIEQTYNKALCRAIENDWLDRQNLLF